MTLRSSLLVTAVELAALLREEADLPPDAPRTRVFDVRWSLAEPNGHATYLTGHIPGAVYVDLESELSAQGAATLGRHPLPSVTGFTASARRWGLNPDDSVVAYDGGGNFGAARLWWLLRDAGFENVRLLDGALPAWVAGGFALETDEQVPAPGTVILARGHRPRIEFDDVAAFAREHVLLDARAHERYTGETEPLDPAAGHIPGAKSRPTTENLDENGFFRPAAELLSQFESIGATGDEPIGVYCGSGITASHEIFALALTGVDAALYPGSWSQWSNHPDLTVATGPTP